MLQSFQKKTLKKEELRDYKQNPRKCKFFATLKTTFNEKVSNTREEFRL